MSTGFDSAAQEMRYNVEDKAWASLPDNQRHSLTMHGRCMSYSRQLRNTDRNEAAWYFNLAASHLRALMRQRGLTPQCILA